jgi:hypothetical protein
MANLFKRAQTEQKQTPLPKVEAQVTVDGSIVTFTIDLDKIAEVAVEREGERDVNGKAVKYMKNPAIMLQGTAKNVQVCQVNPADGIEYMLECDFTLGQGGAGVYAPITRTKVIGTVETGKGLVTTADLLAAHQALAEQA